MGKAGWFLIVLLISAAPVFSAQPQLRIGKYAGRAQEKTSVRVASCSVVPRKWDKAANWEGIERMVHQAADQSGAYLIVTPEGALEGYVVNEVNETRGTERWEETVKRFVALAEPLDGPYVQKAATLADELDVFFLLGMLERRGDLLFNSALLFDPDGDIIARYSKTHFAQGYEINPAGYTPGDAYPVFDTPFGKVGIMICYDRQLPEVARIMAVKGAQILLIPSYGVYGTDWNTEMLKTRAYENGCYLVFTHPFQSLLINRSGNLNVTGGPNQAVTYDIDTDPKQFEGRFKNRRPETYGELIK